MSSLAGYAGLITAEVQLQDTQYLLAAVRSVPNAVQGYLGVGGEQLGLARGVDRWEPCCCDRWLEPCYAARRIIHLPPKYAPRQVIHLPPEYEYCCRPCEPATPPHLTPPPPPPGEIPQWPGAPAPLMPQQIKIVQAQPDTETKGALLDLFI